MCVWIATSGETSPALAQMMKAFGPLAAGLTGGKATVDDATIAAASRQLVSVTIFAPEPDDPNDTTTNETSDTTDPEERATFIELPGIGKRAAMLIPPAAAGAGVGFGSVQLNDNRGLFVQALLAQTPSKDAMVALLKAAAGRA